MSVHAKHSEHDAVAAFSVASARRGREIGRLVANNTKVMPPSVHPTRTRHTQSGKRLSRRGTGYYWQKGAEEAIVGEPDVCCILNVLGVVTAHAKLARR